MPPALATHWDLASPWVGWAQALGDLLTAATLHLQERRVVHDVSQASAASAISFEPKWLRMMMLMIMIMLITMLRALTFIFYSCTYGN